MNQPTRLFDFAYYAAEKHPRPDALNKKVNGEWIPLSSTDFIARSEKLAMGLIDLGVQPGDRVAIISTNNRPEWNICDQGILSAGAVDVPVYPTISPEDYEFIFNDSEVQYVFLSDQELADKVNKVKDKIPSLKGIYGFESLNGAPSWEEVISRGGEQHRDELKRRMDAVKPEQLATLIYTSGTTGTPKGVMLSHNNLASNASAAAPRLHVSAGSKSLSFLPLCHSYERVLVYVYMTAGVGVYYAESMETIGDNIREVHPDVFSAVPRLLEKVYDRIMEKGKSLKGVKRLLFFWAVGLAKKYEHEGKSGWYKARLNLARKLIFSKWQEALGGNVKAIACGAAALNPNLARIFAGAGINIQEGYGLTEASPVITVNLPTGHGHKLGTVGTPLDNVHVKLDADGEILAKGPNIMMGYYNRPDLTAEAITEEGYLRTGDIGEILPGGYLRITDRKKEIFKTAGGKYIAPAHMENAYKESGFIEQCMIAGENQKHSVIFIQPSFDFLKEWCRRHDVEWTSEAEIVNNQTVVDRIWEEVEHINPQFGKWEQPKKMHLCGELWNVDNGQLTPTMKLRRKPILKMYAEAYDAMYAS